MPYTTELPTPEGAAVTALILETFRLNGRMLAAGGRLTRGIGLTSARWQVVGAIALARRPRPVAQIARNMGLTRQAVQRIVNELAATGLVGFAANPNHRRAKLVVLTASGRDAYRAATDSQIPWSNGLAAGLDPGAVRAAVAVMRTLRQRLEADEPGAGAPPLEEEPRPPASS